MASKPFSWKFNWTFYLSVFVFFLAVLSRILYTERFQWLHFIVFRDFCYLLMALEALKLFLENFDRPFELSSFLFFFLITSTLVFLMTYLIYFWQSKQWFVCCFYDAADGFVAMTLCGFRTFHFFNSCHCLSHFVFFFSNNSVEKKAYCFSKKHLNK